MEGNIDKQILKGNLLCERTLMNTRLVLTKIDIFSGTLYQRTKDDHY